MSAEWDELARHYGRKAVLDLHISDGEVDEITEEQAAYVIPLLKKHLEGYELFGLDYGCGAGRWAKHLAPLFFNLTGCDPSLEMLKLAPKLDGVTYVGPVPIGHYDVIFCWVVLGGIPDRELVPTIHQMIDRLNPNGLLFFADHMEPPPHQTWWRFREMSVYAKIFADTGLPLRRIGECRQLAHSVTIMAGRKAEKRNITREEVEMFDRALLASGTIIGDII